MPIHSPCLLCQFSVTSTSLYHQFQGFSQKYFFLVFPDQEKINSEVSVKYLTVFFQISTSGAYYKAHTQ